MFMVCKCTLSRYSENIVFTYAVSNTSQRSWSVVNWIVNSRLTTVIFLSGKQRFWLGPSVHATLPAQAP